MTLLGVLLATALAGIGSVWLAALLSKALSAYTQHMLSLAAGALLATALLHLMPEALQSDRSAQELFALLLGGLVFFFLLDKAELWHHGHEHADSQAHGHGNRHGHSHAHDHGHGQRSGWAVLLGDSVHCFGDGILIAAAFVADARLGMAATLAVLAHEVPHHMGDLAVLQRSSANARQALLKLSAAGAVCVVGGALGYAFAAALREYSPFFLVVASSSFIYVALADLIPQLQKRLDARQTAAQVLWLGVGIGAVALATQLAHGH